MPLRLFLLVCVAAMLRPDICQAQGQQYLTPTEFAAALLIHFSAEDALDSTELSHPAQPKAFQPARRAVKRWPVATTSLQPQALVSHFPSRPGQGTRFKARSTLPADPIPTRS